MDEEFVRRRKWFDEYLEKIEKGLIVTSQEWTHHTCPCCGYPTLSERGNYEICDLCEWEDDGQDDPRADTVWGGPNGGYSLTEGRQNFRKYLIQYCPEKTPNAFQPESWKQRVDARKRELMDLYQRIMTEPDLDKHIELWYEEKPLMDKIFQVGVTEAIANFPPNKYLF